MLYRARTGVRLGSSAARDGEQARALFLAWEEIGPLLAYAPEDGELQAVVAMRDLLRDLYSDTLPRADIRAAELARASACIVGRLPASFWRKTLHWRWLMRRSLALVWSRCAPMPLRASTPFSSGPTPTTRSTGGNARGNGITTGGAGGHAALGVVVFKI